MNSSEWECEEENNERKTCLVVVFMAVFAMFVLCKHKMSQEEKGRKDVCDAKIKTFDSFINQI